MLDIKWIRENAELFDVAMQNRNQQIRSKDLLKIDEEKRRIITKIQELQSERNSIVNDIAVIKKGGGNADELMEKSKLITAEIKKIEEGFNQDELENLLLQIPNIPSPEVPIGKDEEENQEVEKWGEIPSFNFTPKQHFEIGESLELMDFEQSTLMSGSRFSTLSGDLAKLERALSNFMLDVANEFGYTEISPPNLVKSDAMMRSGQLPKFAEEAFKTTNDYWLVPTSEVSLVNFVAKKTLDEKKLPLRFTSYTPCFRSEAGAAGKDTRGMIRQHQFKKVELVSITTQEQSEEEHQKMTNVACEILRRLKLPYRKVLLCTGDMGFCSQKTYDLEVWLPGQNKYREISSCSNCGDFQGRRLEAKYKPQDSKKSLLVHTLNGSALAVGRTIVAILENYQNQDCSANVPEVLVSYMGGVKQIRKF
ncbi:MAG: seryl-tRNA synthetase [Rickettsiaceae bacterium]|jgi:seryl-tRNA synthetase|nr:seryl-tRNA synthetase [Rickettsiaceae bacterium]